MVCTISCDVGLETFKACRFLHHPTSFVFSPKNNKNVGDLVLPFSVRLDSLRSLFYVAILNKYLHFKRLIAKPTSQPTNLTSVTEIINLSKGSDREFLKSGRVSSPTSTPVTWI